MDASQQKEIEALKAKLDAAEATVAKLLEIETLKAKLDSAHATIAELSSSKVIGVAAAEPEDAFSDSRFPLFRKVQASLSGQRMLKPQDEGSVGDLEITSKKHAPDWSVEQLFLKYDVDRSGMLDLNEFGAFVREMNLPVSFGAMAQDTAKSAEAFASDLAKDTAKSAETLVSDTARSADELAKSVLGSVNDLAKGVNDDLAKGVNDLSKGVNDLAKGVNDLAVSAGVPGATASVPLTLVGGCGSGYKEMLPAISSGKGVPVEPLILAVERQATLTTQLGGFMQLIVKLDQANMRTVRESWERHGQPSSLHELLEAEVAEGVIEPTRLKEGSAALSLLWSMRAKRFWTTVADGFADQETTEPSSSFGLRAYEAELEPYHGFLFKNTFRAGLRALPSRKEMLGNMALMPSESMGLTAHWEGWEESAAAGEGLTSEERMAACLLELRECSEATKRVTNMVQAQLDEFGLRDDRKL